MLHISRIYTDKQKLNIIKELIQEDSTNRRKAILSYHQLNGLSYQDSLKIDVQYEYIKKIKDDIEFYKRSYRKEIELYNKILDSMVDLAKELKLTNALEHSNLFTYLLWNGYLSIDKELYFDVKNTKAKNGILFLDIIKGYTTCLNNSCFLKDYLNKAGFQSIILENQYRNIIKKYVPNIERKEQTHLFYDLINNLVNYLVNRNSENHAFTLIKEKDNTFIYDSTTLSVFSIISSTQAKIITGEGTCELGPIPSYGYINNKDDEKILDNLMENNCNCLYEFDTITDIWEKNSDLFLNNPLIDDYYENSHQDLNKILKLKKKY